MLTSVKRHFRQGMEVLEVLKEVEFILQPGEIVALVGPSGAGKSTLLQIAGLLESPDAGAVRVAGYQTDQLPDSRRTILRRDYLGFIYQYHHLLSEFSALENVVMPQMIASVPHRQAVNRAQHLLERMRLGERAQYWPSQLSGGEQQRVAIARALANQPRVLLADEPTGNLDSDTSGQVFAELLRLAREDRLAALIATHNLALARCTDRVLELRNGCLQPFTPALHLRGEY
ncbi:Lipoprotein releasing system ATP-binding protein LolD [invertebrate metagenome]|uniref:Lipoprotein releasing system ATP-binding protein LolD n=1 Tax=invertebrate metagenome TaxID=1711999 RepID=A0A484HAQ2_9ZZZZ